MKTTLDIPNELMRGMKIRAATQGRKLKDVVAEVLKRGLADPVKPAKPRIEIQANGLPVIRCGKDAPASRMTTEELLALEQATLLREDLQRVGLAL